MRKYKNMIQRIQSIYLLVASVLQGLLFFVPFATSEQPSPGILEDARYDIYDDLIVLIIVSVCVAISVISIFLFRNRTLQARISVLAALLSCGLLFWIGFSAYKLPGSLTLTGIVIPLLTVIPLMLARHSILTDERLVKSADRLR